MIEAKTIICLMAVMGAALTLVSAEAPARQQSSSVEYSVPAPTEISPSGGPETAANEAPVSVADEPDKKSALDELPYIAPTCTCPGAAAEPPPKSKPKKVAKKYKVITISMPEDSETDADAIIETKVDEQPEQQVEANKEGKQKKQAAAIDVSLDSGNKSGQMLPLDPIWIEEEEAVKEDLETIPIRNNEKKLKDVKVSKRVGSDKGELKSRSKRDTEQKQRSKRGNDKNTKRYSGQSKEKKYRPKNGGNNKKDKKRK